MMKGILNKIFWQNSSSVFCFPSEAQLKEKSLKKTHRGNGQCSEKRGISMKICSLSFKAFYVEKHKKNIFLTFFYTC